jgi:hypothetical protein
MNIAPRFRLSTSLFEIEVTVNLVTRNSLSIEDTPPRRSMLLPSDRAKRARSTACLSPLVNCLPLPLSTAFGDSTVAATASNDPSIVICRNKQKMNGSTVEVRLKFWLITKGLLPRVGEHFKYLQRTTKKSTTDESLGYGLISLCELIR